MNARDKVVDDVIHLHSPNPYTYSVYMFIYYFFVQDNVLCEISVIGELYNLNGKIR